MYRSNPNLDYFYQEDDIKVVLSNIVTAFDEITVGSKVTDPDRFMDLVIDAIETFDFEAQEIPGQGYIILPEEVVQFVSGGVAKISPDDQEDWYVCREHREKISAYLRRDIAEAQGRNIATKCAVVVNTREAYLNDPDVLKDPVEIARISATDATHVLVAVLASSGPHSPLPPFRFVANLAGGNREALKWDGDTIRSKAEEIYVYYSQYVGVAD